MALEHRGKAGGRAVSGTHFWLRVVCEIYWEPRDLWVGLYWKRKANLLQVWICLLPCLPLHLVWVRLPSQMRELERGRRP